MNILIKMVWLTAPGKKQQCFRSMYRPKAICNKDNRMQHVSTMSHSYDNGCERRADSLQVNKYSKCYSID